MSMSYECDNLLNSIYDFGERFAVDGQVLKSSGPLVR